MSLSWTQERKEEVVNVSFLDTGEERRGGQCLFVRTQERRGGQCLFDRTQERKEEVAKVSLLGHSRGKKRWPVSLS